MTQTWTSKRLALFPDSTQVEDHQGTSQITISGVSLHDLAQKHGTPLYIYDKATMDQAVRSYRAALEKEYPGKSGLTYAGKAFLCLAIGEWVKKQGLWLDCTGATELGIAIKAGIPAKNLLLHGVSKTHKDLRAAIHSAGTIVIDHLGEIDRILQISEDEKLKIPELWLRLRPGLDVETHNYTRTGGDTSKFGFSITEFDRGFTTLIRRKLMPTGVHFHLGSHFHDPSPLAAALEITLDLIKFLFHKYDWQPHFFSPGGGWGVPYHESDLPHPSVEEYVHYLCEQLVIGCQRRGLNLPHLQLEPGRSLIARAGVAVYQVQASKYSRNRRWLLIDGGLSDNPRPALYQARYTALTVIQPERPISEPAWIGGPYCESSDVLIHDLPMPEVEPGEFLAIPVSGAYQLSMSSNYNGALRPSVIWLEGNRPHLIRRRETLDDLLLRDYSLADRSS